MDSRNSSAPYWIVATIILFMLVIGVSLWYSQSTPTTDDTTPTTTTQDVATTSDATTSSTSTSTPTTKSSASVRMSAADFKLFTEAGHCKEVAHSKELAGYRAIDFTKVMIAVGQTAWLCGDGEYYTNN